MNAPGSILHSPARYAGLIFILGLGLPAVAQVVEDQKLMGDAGGLGSSISMDGDTALIGAQNDDEAATSAGAAFVFTRMGGVWTLQQKLIASDAEEDDHFGFSVSLSGDTALVSMRGGITALGAAYVFTRTEGVWSEQQILVSDDLEAGDNFGDSVSIDGDTAVVGAFDNRQLGTSSGAAYVFTRSGSIWTQQQRLRGIGELPGDRFGSSVAVSGETVVVSGGGNAYVLTRSDGVWTELQQLVPDNPGAVSGNFARAIALSGDTALIFANSEDAGGVAYVFTRAGTVWSEQQRLEADHPILDAAGFSAAVAVVGDIAVVGARTDSEAGEWAGAAYVFVRSGTTWTQTQKLIASDAMAHDFGGSSVSVFGDTAMASGGGDVYVYVDITVPMPREPDLDGDGVRDVDDNCSEAFNAAQDDTDLDDCGNVCDADYEQSGTVGFGDFGMFTAFFGTTNPLYQHIEPIGGRHVGFGDFGFFVGHFGSVPGPSGTTAGTVACP